MPGNAPASEAPLLSIGLAVYNEEARLADALDALLRMAPRPFEIVVCDDASTDGSAAVCREYAGRDPRIRFVQNSRNRGSVFTYNRVLALAQGKYFLWVTPHDVRHPDSLAQCVEALEFRSDAVLCHTGVDLIDAEDRIIGRVAEPLASPSDSAYRRARDVLWGMACRRQLDPVDGVYRREALLRTGGLRNQWGTDNLLLLMISLEGPFLFLPEPLLRLRYQREPSPNLRSHVAAYLLRLDPANNSRRWMPTYLQLLRSYLEVLGRAPLPRAQRLWLQGHAAASILRYYALELVLHDLLFGALGLLLGERWTSRLVAPFDAAARRTKYAWHPGISVPGRRDDRRLSEPWPLETGRSASAGSVECAGGGRRDPSWKPTTPDHP